MKENFALVHSDKKSFARVGELRLAHGNIETPFFMPVATKGSVKHLSLEEVSDFGVRCLISNALIFYLRPGLEIICKAKGLHRFMDWKHGLFTDSGGFQILDETFLRARKEEGVILNNPFTKKAELFNPEKCMQVQQILGADVAMCLDDVPRYGESKGKLFYAETLNRTLNWAQRCLNAHTHEKQLLFGISQGGTFWDLRKKGLMKLNAMGFDGIALGGLAIGEPKQTMQNIIRMSRKTMDETKPLYVMGLGSPEDVITSISNGADIFDSTFPTRVARHGTALTHLGKISIENLKYAVDFSSLDKECDCVVCVSHSKAYIHHLCKNKEETGFRFLTHHNVYFMQHLIESVREAIQEKRFTSFSKQFLSQYTK